MKQDLDAYLLRSAHGAAGPGEASVITTSSLTPSSWQVPVCPAWEDGPASCRRGHRVHDGGTARLPTRAHSRTQQTNVIAQPTLSQQIRRLEEMVGTPVLHRRREGVRLTTAGSVLLEESRAVLSLIELGMSRTRQAASSRGA